MNLPAFLDSLEQPSPPAALERAPVLRALWLARRGDWEAAHGLVAAEQSPEAAWVHAYLHRVEGDESNARYWYRRAGRPEQDGDLEVEWGELARELVGATDL